MELPQLRIYRRLKDVEEVVVYLEAVFWRFSGGTKENHNISQSRQSLSRILNLGFSE
jgi:hypothetical protein